MHCEQLEPRCLSSAAPVPLAPVGLSHASQFAWLPVPNVGRYEVEVFEHGRPTVVQFVDATHVSISTPLYIPLEWRVRTVYHNRIDESFGPWSAFVPFENILGRRLA